jgi:hypothetical protein
MAAMDLIRWVGSGWALAGAGRHRRWERKIVARRRAKKRTPERTMQAMARNVVDQAKDDVAVFIQNKQASALAEKLGASPSRLYHAEVAALLIQECVLDEVQQAANHDADVADSAYAKDQATQPKDRAESEQALQDKEAARGADAAKTAIKEGVDDRQQIARAVQDADKTAGDKDMWNGVYMASLSGPDSIYLERFLYEIKLKRGLSFLASVNPDQTRLFLGQALGMAENDGLISGSEVVAETHYGTEGPDPLAEQAAAAVGDPIRDNQQRLKAAEEKIRALEEQLNIALQEITPTIADENKVDDVGSIDNAKIVKFITTYRSSPEYKAAEFEVTQARKALGLSLQDHEADLAAHATDPRNPTVAAQAHDAILDAYMSMAASDQPKTAKAWVSQHQCDPNYVTPADKARLQTIDDVATDTAARIAMADLKKIFESKDSEESKFDQAIAYVDEKIVKPYDAFDKVGELRSIPELLKQQKVVWQLKHAKDDQIALEIAKTFVEAGEKEKAASLAKRINLALGTLLLGIGNARGLQEGGDALLRHGADIHDFYAKAQELHEALGTGAEEGEEAVKLAKEVRSSYFTLARGFGALALVGDVYAISEDWNLANETPVAIAKLAGDLIAAVGDAMTLIPGLEPLGEAISIVGNAIAVIADAFIGDPVGDRRRTATRQTLIDGGLLDPQQATSATYRDSAGNVQYTTTLTGNAALDPAQIQTLLETHSFLFQDAGMIEAAHGLWGFYINNRSQAGYELQSPYRDTFFAFLNGGDAGKMQLPILYARPYTTNGVFDPFPAGGDSSNYGMVAATQIRDAYPKGAFA